MKLATTPTPRRPAISDDFEDDGPYFCSGFATALPIAALLWGLILVACSWVWNRFFGKA